MNRPKLDDFKLNPLNIQCTFGYIILCTTQKRLCAVHAGSASAEWVGQGKVGGVTCRVSCTWWLLGLAVKVPWLGMGRPILALAAWTGLENATLALQVYLWQGRLLGLWVSV